jgi:Ser/Thr protein kinase RdoA (MazF antagonist)
VPEPFVPEPDVTRALGELDLEPVSFTPIGGYPRWRRGRVTYRVDLAGGEVVKVRRVTRPRTSLGAAALLRALDDPDLAAPRFAAGRVTIEDWVDGVAVATDDPDGTHVDAAADLLARLHARTALPDRRFQRIGATAPLRVKTERRLAVLQDAGVASVAEVRRLVATLDTELPDRAARGPVHGDLCAENLVVTPDGQVVSIDNERVRIDFLDYDLARTWVRWPMPAVSYERFERRYASSGRTPPATPEAMAWRVCAATKSAFTRLGTPTVGPALARAQVERILDH